MAVAPDDPMRAARVDVLGVEREVSLVHVPDARVGDYVIIHVGFALQVLDEAEALRTLALFEQIDELGAGIRT